MRSNYKKPEFSHFVSLPFIRKKQRQLISKIQTSVEDQLKEQLSLGQINKHKTTLMHLTLSMLVLSKNALRQKAVEIIQQIMEELQAELKYVTLTFSELSYFTGINYQSKRQQVKSIGLKVQNNIHLQKIRRASDRVIKKMLQFHIVREEDLKAMHIYFNQQSKMFQSKDYHLTLFRFKNVAFNQKFKQLFHSLSFKHPLKLHCDFFDISTRFQFDSSDYYKPLVRVLLQSHN